MKMPVKFRRGKRGFNLGKAQQIPKVDLEGKRQKKNMNYKHIFWYL